MIKAADEEKPFLSPVEVYDTGDQKPNDVKLNGFHVFAGLVALLMILIGVLWLGELFGLFTAIIPGGLGFFDGIVWGIVGGAGLVLLGMLVWSLRRRRAD